MKIGCVKEIKKYEDRVGITPTGARSYIAHGNTVYMEKDAGVGSGYTDDDYKAAGCKILPTAGAVWGESEMIVKVKEPLEAEYGLIRENQIVYTYMHLAPDRPQTDALLNSKCIGIAFETIRDKNGALPCLRPMSQIAGRMSIQEGAKYLESPFHGRGVLLAGVPGVPQAEVFVVGAGEVGSNAVKTAVGMGAHVTVCDVNLDALERLESLYGNGISTIYSTAENIQDEIQKADLVIGAVLIPGSSTPQLIKKSHLKTMKKGAVIVDVAIDQGGASEASHVTFHDDPVFVLDGVVNYCVGNMPGAVPNTSSHALENATLPRGIAIASKGVAQALRDDPGLLEGLNVYKGKVTYKGVADAHKLPYTPAKEVIG
jgi:alanine dehydrogenase